MSNKPQIGKTKHRRLVTDSQQHLRSASMNIREGDYLLDDLPVTKHDGEMGWFISAHDKEKLRRYLSLAKDAINDGLLTSIDNVKLIDEAPNVEA